MAKFDKAGEGMKIQSKRQGSIQIILASLLFGALPLLSRLGYRGGANAVTLLAVRFSISTVLIWSYLLWTKTKIKVDLKQLVIFALVAIFGYGAMAYSYFNSFHYIPSSMAAMIMFTYPVLVTYFSALLLKSPITRRKLIALILVTIGAISMAWGDISFNLLGILLAGIAALCYACYIVYLGSPYTYQQDPKVLTAFIILFAAIFFLVFGAVRGELIFDLQPLAWWSVLIMSIFSTVIAIMAFYAGVQKIGPALAAIISTVEPLTALCLAILFLGEQMSLSQWLGAVLIIIGVIFVQMPQPKPKVDWKARV